MKRLFLLSTLAAGLSLIAGVAFLGVAADLTPDGVALTNESAPVVSPVTGEEINSSAVELDLQLWLVEQAIRHPWLGLLLLLVATARFGVKPLMAWAHHYVESTATPEDDAALARFEASRAFYWLSLTLDTLGSVKLTTVLLLVSRWRSRGIAESTRTLAVAGLASITLLGMPGCMTSGSLALRAEQTIATSFATTDAFLQWEETNRDTVSEEITAVADTLRSDFPPAHEAALDALAAYKRSRDVESYDALRAWLTTLQEMTAAAKRARAEIVQSATSE
ncbi:MAG: hypothetical protein KIT22_07780 [Verrucomicrobiae bacterium]|nr:hypothetical protein [Verrucomicrobiae bacterium]